MVRPVYIETERLILSETDTSIEDVINPKCSDKVDLTDYLATLSGDELETIITDQTAITNLQGLLSLTTDDNRIDLSIKKKSGVVIGYVNLHHIEDMVPIPNFYCCVIESEERHGYGSEVISAVLNWYNTHYHERPLLATVFPFDDTAVYFCKKFGGVRLTPKSLVEEHLFHVYKFPKS